MKKYIKMTYFPIVILVAVSAMLALASHPCVFQYTSRLLDGDSGITAIPDTVWQQEGFLHTVRGITSAENEYRAKVASERLTSADGIMPDTINGIWATASGFDPNSKAVMTYIDSADDYVWPEAGVLTYGGGSDAYRGTSAYASYEASAVSWFHKMILPLMILMAISTVIGCVGILITIWMGYKEHKEAA